MNILIIDNGLKNYDQIVIVVMDKWNSKGIG
jgi:hypothetical protein